MKKLVVLCVFFVGVALFVPQPLAADFGIKGGLNLSSYSVTAEPGFEWTSHSLTGFTVGGFYTFSLSPKFAIQPEVYYATYGEKESDPGDSFIFYKEQLNYIHVPVLLKFKLGGGGFMPHLFAGPYMSFLVSGTGTDYNLDGSVFETFDVKPFHKSSVYGFTFGLDLEKKLEKVLLVLDVRYNLDMVRNDIADIEEPWSSKTRVWTFMIGIGF